METTEVYAANFSLRSLLGATGIVIFSTVIADTTELAPTRDIGN